MSAESTRALRSRLADLRRARAELPPHSAQQWREDLDQRISDLQRRLARQDPGG